MADDPPSHLTGIVIITLPPPDNPSLGKTITAFTLSDTQQSSTPHETPLPQNLGRQPIRSFSHSSPRSLLPVLALSLIALYLWASFSQETLFELGDDYVENDDGHHKNKSQTQTTLIFPLYRKPYGGNGDVELKLGRLGGWKEVVGKSNKKSMSTSSKIDSSSVIPVAGNGYLDGLYYTYLLLGNPPRPYFLDVDTGSDLTWIQCDAPCNSCAKGAHPFYKPVKTNIIPYEDSYCLEIQKNQQRKGCDSCQQCDYEIEYADHSSSMGVLARDELALNIANGSLAKSKVVFGCAYDQQGLLLNTLGKTDGILGLSRAKISLPSQLANQGIIENVVGHCLTTDTSGGGYLFFGDDFVPQWKMSWVPMLHSLDSNSYQTEIMKVNYGSRQIGLDNVKGEQSRIIFDTGSSYSYFTEEAYNNLVTLLKVISSESLVLDTSDTSFPMCWQAKSPLRSVKDVRQFFKPVILQFRSKWWILSRKLHIPPEGYLVISSKGNACLGIFNGREVHDGSTFILGDISLRGLLFVYDNVNEKIGWVQSDCSKPTTFESHSTNPVLGL